MVVITVFIALLSYKDIYRALEILCSYYCIFRPCCR